MTDVNHLTKLQRLVLAALEEAGEENIGSLTNTLQKPRCGSPQEIETMIVALSGLIECDLVRIAISRNAVRHWIDLSKEESLALVGNISSQLQWSDSERIWCWNKNAPRPEVVITKAGEAAAHQVLREDGWPI
jgi:hypothetical protein